MIRNYLKIAVKVLLRRKFFTFISLFGISVTLLVLLVATAMIDHTIAPQAPESRADRMLGFQKLRMQGPDSTWTSEPGYAFLDKHIRSLTALPGVETVTVFSNNASASSYLAGRKITSSVKRTDGRFWQVFDFEFLEGQPFSVADEENGNFVAVISEATRERFFGDQKAVGQSIEVDGQRFRVVGVVRNVPVIRNNSSADLWVPISTAKTSGYKDQVVMGNFNAMILARSRADFPAIKSEVQARLRQAEKNLPDPKMYKTLAGGADTAFEALSRSLLPGDFDQEPGARLQKVLFLALMLFLLLPTMNLVNINLSRILDRASEIGVRKAFGASSRTLVGQFLVENLVLTLVGAGFGLLLAALVLAALNSSGVIPYAHFTLNYRVFLQGLGIALFFALLSGVYPAWRMSRLHPVKALRGRTV
ncbi:MAG TPA: ABC transporter permease [Thermoanaerobaculia bacterium]|nr:ABC transporter permease [Thermoanaerobaculia bacterium]